jgi:hypothetical protein
MSSLTSLELDLDDRSGNMVKKRRSEAGRPFGELLKCLVSYGEWSNNSDDCEGGGTVHQDRALPENRTLHPKADRNSRFQTLHITELVTFRRVTLPEKPWLLLM